MKGELKGKNWYGWAGTILNVDLTKEKITKQPFEKSTAVNFLGGDGLGNKLLFDRLPVDTLLMDPRNLFILSTGHLTGTLAPSCGRLSVVFKSPVSSLIGTSKSGGFLAPEIKRTGYDAIVISGKAKEPVWLWIDNYTVEIKSAKRN